MIHNFLMRVRRALRAFESEQADDRSSWQLTVTLERDDLDGGWIAECLELPGCVAQGETAEEALVNIKDAIVGVIAARMERQVPEVLHDTSGTQRRRVALIV